VTIAVSVKINDEIVLVTDSASTGAMLGGPYPSVICVYDNANQGFNVAPRTDV
jgi:hypothetical protein